MNYRDFFAIIGATFSFGCLALIVWLVWSGVRQASIIAAHRRKIDARLLEIGRRIVVQDAEDRQELVN